MCHVVLPFQNYLRTAGDKRATRQASACTVGFLEVQSMTFRDHVCGSAEKLGKYVRETVCEATTVDSHLRGAPLKCNIFEMSGRACER